MSHQEWFPTLVSAAGEPGIVEKLKEGYDADGKHFKVHVDGYDALHYLLGHTDESPRDWFFYTSDDGLITAIRYSDWKAVFYEQRAKGMQLWAEPFVPLRLPKIFNLRRDPFERADENANVYWDWVLDHIFVMYPMQALAAEQIQSFAQFPPRQKPGAFNLDSVLEQMDEAGGGGLH
jgi:arylsulfatase